MNLPRNYGRLHRVAQWHVLLLVVVALVLASFRVTAAERPDLLVADFEAETYGDWKVTGEAFGTGPAAGTLPNQMPVTGYLGKRLVNSYHGGDQATGTLTSPPFTLARKHVNFLIGGGKYPGQTCINLLLDGHVIRSATGPNDKPGGSEQLDWHCWDVSELEGKEAVIQIVDAHTGGWGHITVDHIIQSDRKWTSGPVRRELWINRHYLHLPVKNGAMVRRLRFEADGATTRDFDIELAEDKPDFWVFADVSRQHGKKLTLETKLPEGSKALEQVYLSDNVPDAAALYREKYRPQFHFTSRRGWLNDPNGLVFAGDTWHLFYQHNPYGWNWGNMHWGHAVSKDLFHWRELPIALSPRQHGDWCFSGSAVVDRDNTSGWRTGTAPLLVCAFTSTGRGECIAYSNDAGRTWTEHVGNPVVKHNGRDPKLIWHAPTRRWVMAVYEENGPSREIAFYTSPDLKKWEFQSRIDGFYECPDLFALAVEGDPKTRRWVLSAADGKYLLGQFDGRKFVKESGKHQVWYGNFYAAQTFDSAQGGRRIQIGWGSGITFPGMPFNQQMTVPCELTLRRTDDGIRLCALPVEELNLLRRGMRVWKDVELRAGDDPLALMRGELFEVQVLFQPQGADQVVFTLRGLQVVYDVRKCEVICQAKTAPLKPQGGRVGLRLLIDRGSIEVFGNEGEIALSAGVLLPPGNQGLALSAKGGSVPVSVLRVYHLKSAWE